MPIWMLVLGILFIFWIGVYLSVYYIKAWTLGAPFSKKTSLKIVFLYYLPLSWLLSSFLFGVILFFIGKLKSIDVLLLIVGPVIITLCFIGYLWFSNHSYKAHEKELQKKLKSYSKASKIWLQEFSFINKENIDLQIYISKENPVGRLIIYGLTPNQQSIVKGKKDSLPPGITLLFAKKKWVQNRNLTFETNHQ